MGREGHVGQTTVEEDGSIRIAMRYPKRGLAGLLISMGLMGLACSVGGIMMKAQTPQGDKTVEKVFFTLFGIAFALAGTLPGLYLLTRRRQVTLADGYVTVEQGWCLWRSLRHEPVSSFRGLSRYTKNLGAMDAASGAGTVLGLAAAAVTGTGAVCGKTMACHFVQLVHRDGSRQNVVLTGSTDSSSILQLATALSELLSLPLLTPTLDGFEEQPAVPQPKLADAAEHGPEAFVYIPEVAAIGKGLSAFPAVEPRGPRAQTPPAGLQISQTGSTTTILCPQGMNGLVGGMILGALFTALGIFSLIHLEEDHHLALFPLGMGLLLLFIGTINAGLRLRIDLYPSLLAWKEAPRSARPLTIRWADIRDISVAKAPAGKPGLLLVTEGPDVWLAVGTRTDRLQWLAATLRNAWRWSLSTRAASS